MSTDNSGTLPQKASDGDSLARVVAFYLPQFHPIPENDEWWGKGFTEWTNVGKARPLFPGHYQPRVPADLGFYDLRLPDTRVAQAELARDYGIEAFCYWHYWFAGRRILERPFTEVLKSGEPKFPFCLGWANQTWAGIWHGDPDRILIGHPHRHQSCDLAERAAIVTEAADEAAVRARVKLSHVQERRAEAIRRWNEAQIVDTPLAKAIADAQRNGLELTPEAAKALAS